jgi:hypothetical protein
MQGESEPAGERQVPGKIFYFFVEKTVWCQLKELIFILGFFSVEEPSAG